MAGKNPAFQFYPGDWSRDLEEHPLEIEGAWIRICCKLWWSETRGMATKNLGQWSKVLRQNRQKTWSILSYLQKENVASITPDALQKKEAFNITIECRRMVKDEKQREYERNKKGRQRTLSPTCPPQCPGDVPDLSPPMSPDCPAPSSDLLSSSSKKTIKIILPDFINPEIWQAFLEMRKKIKKPATEYAKKLIIKELLSFKKEFGDDPNIVLEKAIIRSYQGVFPLKANTKSKKITLDPEIWGPD